MKNLKEILAGISYEVLGGNEDVFIKRISYDSRDIQKDYAFVALCGENTDGHKYIGGVVKSGASVIIIQNKIDEKIDLPDSVTIIKIENTRVSLSRIAANFYEHPSDKLKIVAITGTNGKTSVCHIAADLLENMGISTGVIGTNGTKIRDEELKVQKTTITTPESLNLQESFSIMVDRGVEIVLMEATSMALDQKRMLDVNIEVGVFTNISPEHISDHGSFEKYLEAKMSLFEMVDKAVINGDDSQLLGIMDLVKDSVSYGENKDAHVQFKIIEQKASQTKAEIFYNGTSKQVVIPLSGIFNVSNTVAAIGICLQLGYSFEDIISGIEFLSDIPGRVERVKNDREIDIIVDFAHTPKAFEPLLQLFKKVKENKLITVFGCGGDRDTEKRPILGKIASLYSDIIIVTSDNSRSEETDDIIDEIISGISKDYKGIIKRETDREVAIQTAVSLAKSGDVLVVAGRGNEKYQLIKDKKIPLEDALIVKKYL